VFYIAENVAKLKLFYSSNDDADDTTTTHYLDLVGEFIEKYHVTEKHIIFAYFIVFIFTYYSLVSLLQYPRRPGLHSKCQFCHKNSYQSASWQCFAWVKQLFPDSNISEV